MWRVLSILISYTEVSMKRTNRSSKNISTFLFEKLKVFTVYISTYGLLVAPISVYSKDDDDEGVNWGDVGSAASSALLEVGQMYLSNEQLQQQQMQMTIKLQELEPKPVPSKLFPGCLLAEPSVKPKNYCENIGDPNSLMMAQHHKQVAERNKDHYEKLLKGGKNATISPHNSGASQLLTNGISCLEQNKDLVNQQLMDKLNELTEMISDIEKNNQLFKEENKKLLSQMKNVDEELNGGGDSLGSV